MFHRGIGIVVAEQLKDTSQVASSEKTAAYLLVICAVICIAAVLVSIS